MIFDHRGNGQLIDRQITFRIPPVTDTESIVKAIHSPDNVSTSKIEMTQSLHRFVGGIGETRQRRRRRDDARIVLHRPVRRVAIDRVAGRQSPAVLAVSFMPLRVLYAVGIVDQRLITVHLAIIGIPVFQPCRVQADVRVMCPEERPSVAFGTAMFDPQR